jgi:glyoxylase-like metal-dependent hydrolase (beta-lactamase superfamily II)
MEAVTDGVWLLSGFPRYAINVYLVADVLIDGGTRWALSRVLRQLKGRKLSQMALTHCHPDHQGVAAAICSRYRIPLACHEADVPAMEGREPMRPSRRVIGWGVRAWAGPPYPVERVLHGGEVIAGFRVIPTPGHTPGHVIYFREADRVAIAGDVFAHMNFLTGRTELKEPPPFFSADPQQNRRSMRLLIDLRPSVVCFGHGPPLRQPELLEEFVARPRRRRSADPVEAVPVEAPVPAVG